MLNLIQTNDYLFLIDEEAKITSNCLHLYDKNNPLCIYSAHQFDESVWYEFKRIISYYSLTKEAKELDLPLLPNPFEKNIEDLCQNFWMSKHNPNISRQEQIFNAFKSGYRAAQSKQFSLEDIKKAIEMARRGISSNIGEFDLNALYGIQDLKDVNHKYSDFDIIQSLSTQQLPKEFFPEYRKVEKYSFKDNFGVENFTFKGVQENDVLISTQNQPGIGGFFITYPMLLIERGKEYKIKKVSSFGFYTVPWIIDEDGNHAIPDYDLFVLKDEKLLKTITNSEGKLELVGTYKW